MHISLIDNVKFLAYLGIAELKYIFTHENFEPTCIYNKRKIDPNKSYQNLVELNK
jgi:hypothetical protein